MEERTCPARLNVLSESVQKKETKFSTPSFVTFSTLVIEVVVKLDLLHGRRRIIIWCSPRYLGGSEVGVQRNRPSIPSQMGSGRTRRENRSFCIGSRPLHSYPRELGCLSPQDSSHWTLVIGWRSAQQPWAKDQSAVAEMSQVQLKMGDQALAGVD